MAIKRGDTRNNALRGTRNADNLSGLAGDDSLFGLAGNDLLDGGVGSDRLEGGDGIDRVDGGRGQDTLFGGRSDDTYVIDNRGDRITENAREGTDTVESYISFTLGANLEDLTLIGAKSANGIGNGLNNVLLGNAANNILRGLGGNDRLSGENGDDQLDGGLGTDILIGGLGNDTYLVNTTSDRIFESQGQGVDTVKSSVSINLGENLENLTLLEAAGVGNGNSLRNIIVGNAANNTLRGGDGADDLTGGGGNDTLIGGNDVDLFIYDTNKAFADSDIGLDTVTDFTAGTDAIVLSKVTFGLSSGVGFGFSVATEFASVANNTAAENSAARIVFSRATRTLFYNANGTSSGFGSSASSGSFATLSGVTNLSTTDIIIQA